MTQNDDKYTDPELRSEIKDKVQAEDKGGKPGQWSARKAQLVASEYKKEAHEKGFEPYTTDKSGKDDAQKSLTNWTKEEWQTSDGSAQATKENGETQRYLPKKAWESMTEKEKEATNEQKLEGSLKGEQYVPNTEAAKDARKEAHEANGDRGAGGKEDISVHGSSFQGNGNKEVSEEPNDKDGEWQESTSESECEASLATQNIEEDATNPISQEKEHHKEDEVPVEGSDKRGVKRKDTSDDDDRSGEDHTKDSEPTPKRAKMASNGTDKHEPTTKKAKQKRDDAPGEQATASRLPTAGQRVHWHANTGWCEGEVVEILKSEKKVNGRTAKASERDPRIVVKSDKSGRSAVHKPSAVYF